MFPDESAASLSPSTSNQPPENELSARQGLERERDEAQAQNEELSSLNAQLQSKIGELDRAQQAQHRSEEFLRLLIESAKDYAIFTLDPERRVNSWNSGAQTICGYTEEEILGQSGDILFVPEDRAKGDPEKEAYKAATEGRAENERWHLRKDGSRFYGSGLNMPLRDETGQLLGFVKIMRDLTQRKQAEDALHASEERLRLAIESAQLGICDWNYQNGEMEGNGQRLVLLGLPAQLGPITTEQFTNSLHPDDRERVWASMVEGIETRGEHNEEYRVVRPEGQTRWVAESGRVVEWEGGKPLRITSILWDVTARKEAEEVLHRSREELEQFVQQRTRELQREVEQRKRAEEGRRELTRRIVTTQEEERGRISRELHDNLGQHLTAVMLGLHALERQISTITGGQRPSDTPQLDKLRELVDGLMVAAHRQAWELRPAELDAMGLEAALGQYIGDWSGRTDIEVDFQAVGWEQRPAREVETTLFRVVQEALTNIARHASASEVSVVLELTPDLASAIIEDNGRGFDTEENTQRLGLLGMQERLAIVGGTLEIESIPGEGTSIFARVPLGARAFPTAIED